MGPVPVAWYTTAGVVVVQTVLNACGTPLAQGLTAPAGRSRVLALMNFQASLHAPRGSPGSFDPAAIAAKSALVRLSLAYAVCALRSTAMAAIEKIATAT